ncbi:MAG: 3-hydroxyacyl-CoA dehydrogenase/enoyl-CoA hydratase family protein [Methanobacteriota archaeon]|nr:MAG: 3-hydroxyacyl-CoA dehydrogenase/enoyl-CoA hydratase family protein [Euryarchaeota archaeon]|tara:strand:- start:8998 stop:11058 length:2061 start_codon:yes stop_codon:yes gene_type:complete
MEPIESVALVGAGTMGSGVAQKAAQEGFRVQLIDRDIQSTERGIQMISSTLGEAVERRIMTQEKVEEVLSNVIPVVNTENVDVATDIVIEAVFEDFEVKSSVFEAIDKSCAEHTVIATNTSSLSVNKLSKSTNRPDKFIGLHFFYHPAKNRLVEIIPGDETSSETLERVEQFCKRIGKVPIICKDKPGFVVNRFFVPWLNEAVLILEDGLGTPEQIDLIAKEVFEIGMGPFALMNATGLPIALHSSDYLSEQLNTPRFKGASLLRKTVNSGNKWVIEETGESTDNYEAIKNRLLGVTFLVAAQIVQENICKLEDVDCGAKVGLRWQKGPFELMNNLGIKESCQIVREYSAIAGKGLQIPVLLENRTEEFAFELVEVKMQGSIARVKINRPDVMNALNVTVVKQLTKIMEDLNHNKDVTTIVFEGAGKAFIAGADVKFFVEKLREDNFKRIYDFTESGHELLNLIEKSQKTTIALTTGITYGGGLEFALSCDYRIGSKKTEFRFPETGIGIYPGLGGTQRMSRIVGVEIARWAILAGNKINGEFSKQLGIIDEFSSETEVENCVLKLAGFEKSENKFRGKPFHITTEIETIMRFYGDNALSEVLSGRTPVGFDAEDPFVVSQLKSLSRKAPIAIKMASQLINESTKTNLDAGLQLELDRLETIFSTKDALEGLSALVESRRPSYQNQ